MRTMFICALATLYTLSMTTVAQTESFAVKMMRHMSAPNFNKNMKPVVVDDPPSMVELADSFRFERPWQSGNRCGPVALYFLLKLSNASALENSSIDDVLESVPVTDRGTSLAQLQEAAERYGLSTGIVRVSPDTLSSLPTPAIIHWSDATDESGAGGHFDVLLDVNAETGCDLVDTTNCSLVTIAPSAVALRASGYALIPNPGLNRTRIVLWPVFVCIWTVVAALAMACAWRFMHSSRRTTGEPATTG